MSTSLKYSYSYSLADVCRFKWCIQECVRLCTTSLPRGTTCISLLYSQRTLDPAVTGQEIIAEQNFLELIPLIGLSNQ